MHESGGHWCSRHRGNDPGRNVSLGARRSIHLPGPADAGVTGISPTSGPAAGGTTVTITGSGFTGVTSVGSGSAGINVQSGATDTQIVVVSPGGTGTVDLTVTTPAGTSATTSNDQFTYV